MEFTTGKGSARIRKGIKRILMVLMGLLLLTGCGSGVKVSDDGKVFHIFASDNTFKVLFEKYYLGTVPISDNGTPADPSDDLFYDKAPGLPEGVEVRWSIHTDRGGTYQQTLDKALQRQRNVEEPIDLFLVEGEDILKYAHADAALDVAKLGVTDFSNAYPYTVEAASADGAVKGVAFRCCPVVLVYRRSIAKAVLGTDDPAQVQAALSDWSKFDTVAALAKEKGYYMTASFADTFPAFSGGVTSAWVDGENKLQFDDRVWDYLDHAKGYVEKGYTLASGPWDAVKKEQMRSEGKTLCFFLPAGGYTRYMGTALRESYGDWAVCQGPQTAILDQTWLLAANGTDNGRIVAECMNAFLNDEDLCAALVANEMLFSNHREVNRRFAADTGYGNGFLGGQNDIVVFGEAAEHVRYAYKTPYDRLLNENFPAIFLDYLLDNTTRERAYANFCQYVSEQYPHIIVPQA